MMDWMPDLNFSEYWNFGNFPICLLHHQNTLNFLTCIKWQYLHIWCVIMSNQFLLSSAASLTYCAYNLISIVFSQILIKRYMKELLKPDLKPYIHPDFLPSSVETRFISLRKNELEFCLAPTGCPGAIWWEGGIPTISSVISVSTQVLKAIWNQRRIWDMSSIEQKKALVLCSASGRNRWSADTYRYIRVLLSAVCLGSDAEHQNLNLEIYRKVTYLSLNYALLVGRESLSGR